MENEVIIILTADIVGAHVSNNQVALADVPQLIQSVFTALTGVGAAAPVAEERREPAVSVRASVKPDAIACLECGARFKMLKRHLNTEHGLTPTQYRARWNLNAEYPIIAPDYAAKRKELAIRIGLGRKAAVIEPPKPARKAGRPRKVAAA